MLLVSAAAVAVAVFFFGYRFWQRWNTPAERERRRRLLVYADGRTTDGTVTDIPDSEADDALLIHYRYVVGGVEYSAAQDVSALPDAIGNARQFLGPATVKYFPRLPANSIVVCEEWSGLRRPSSSSDEALGNPAPAPDIQNL